MVNLSNQTLANLLLLLGSIFIFFFGIEFALRITGIQKAGHNPPLIYQKSTNPDLSYELKPNLNAKAFRSRITTNSMGLRMGEIDPAKPTIAILGDSITFGYGLQDNQTIPYHIGQNFSDYNVINGGTPGYNVRQEAALYEEKVAQFDPKALVLIFYFNDLGAKTAFLHTDGTLRPEGWTADLDKCDPIQEGVLGYLPGRCWLDTNSAFYKIVKKVVSIRRNKEEAEEEREVAHENPEVESIPDVELFEYEADLTRLTNQLPSDLPRLFVIWPDNEMHEYARSELKRIAADQGFSILDLYDTFGNNVPTLSWDTVHPNPVAAKKAAEKITEAVQQLEI